MATGWARDGAVNEQIEASIEDELRRLKAQRTPQGASFTHCAECGEEIPEARREALPGVKLCIDCASERTRAARRRASSSSMEASICSCTAPSRAHPVAMAPR